MSEGKSKPSLRISLAHVKVGEPLSASDLRPITPGMHDGASSIASAHSVVTPVGKLFVSPIPTDSPASRQEDVSSEDDASVTSEVTEAVRIVTGMYMGGSVPSELSFGRVIVVRCRSPRCFRRVSHEWKREYLKGLGSRVLVKEIQST